MAEAAPRRYDDLTQCGICLLALEEPKALPCLHSFCLKCLRQWAHGKTSVRCPLCVQEFQIPSGGVSSFTTNFLINTLKEREENATTTVSKEKVAPCACCELKRKIVGCCNDCGGFICGDCVSSHSKIKYLKDHIITLNDDLQSEKIETKSTHQKKHCKVHEEQVLRFYCETCKEVICRDCTVVDHPTSCHSLVDLDSATKGQKKEIEQLIKNYDDAREKFNKSLEDLDALSEMLVKNAAKAVKDIETAFDNAVKLLTNNRDKLIDEVKVVVSKREKQIKDEKDTIQQQQTQIATALQKANEVSQTDSDYEMAQVCSSLKTDLTALKPAQVPETLGDVSFRPTPTSKHGMCNLGSISHVSTGILTISQHVKKVVGVWKMTKSFGDTGKGKLSLGMDIAITQQRDIAVADNWDHSIKIFYTSGNLKYKAAIDTPLCVKVSQDGQVFVTNNTRVSVYDRRMILQQQFAIKSPNGVSSDRHDTKIRGLAFNNNSMLLVGECKQKYISKHLLLGRHVMSFKLPIEPYYISVSSQDKVIVSSLIDREVLILDEQGNHLHTVRPPTGLSSWSPQGICCTSGDEFYIATSTGSIDIYSAESGGYIGCLTQNVTNPRGLALMDGKDELLVVENNKIKIFQQE